MVDWVLSNLLWQLLEWYIVGLVALVPGWGLAKHALGLLDNRRKEIAFAMTVPVIFALGLTAISVATSPSIQLVGEAERIGKGYDSPGSPEIRNGIVVIESITNAGSAPSIVRNFQLRLTLRDKTFYAERRTLPAGTLMLRQKKSEETTIYDTRDMLYDKALTAVQPGGQVTGILLFNFSDLTDGTIENEEDPALLLSFQDARGKTYTQPIRFSSEPYRPTVIPGIFQAIPSQQARQSTTAPPPPPAASP